MSSQTANAVRTPFIYIRRDLPEIYIEEMKKLGAKVAVEPWEWNKEEPTPKIDLTNCDVLLTLGMRDDLSVLKYAPNVKWVHSFSVGIEAMIKSNFQNNSDIIVTNSKGCTAIPIAEHTLAMILAFSRGLQTMINNKKDCSWETIPTIDLALATVGIIGYGQIGLAIAERCKALGMRVIGCKRNPDKKLEEHDDADEIVGMGELDSVLAQSDFVVLSLPSTKETKYLFDKEKLKKMKKGSYLINVGRGDAIIESDLVEVLNEGLLAGASLDVFEVEPLPVNHPFWTMDNVIVSPHNAYFSSQHMEHNMELFMTNLKNYMEGNSLINVVDKQLGY
ncbi:D-2-hydroxyacid dehydrogenase [Ureibacillus aquaedulcis]|uniref:D-2-hydroxyacid dehydrogenase n=1 Tax=Ureibacillus aquaedulcis TaxID=3058421 RepID=A0ABT8GT57_9BACL|nr:D-2-hydroxyacid dehydrogenase [Ureibacillus sp. BA0131]MDN4494588.1 D-2-hydroxyacid dehydrogenase [Ureibacillus sp. BA0131]